MSPRTVTNDLLQMSLRQSGSDRFQQLLEFGELAAQDPHRVFRSVGSAGHVAEHQVRGASLGEGLDPVSDLFGASEPGQFLHELHGNLRGEASQLVGIKFVWDEVDLTAAARPGAVATSPRTCGPSTTT